MRTIFVCVFLLSPVVSHAQSQQPVPTPPKVSQPNQQQAESQKSESKPDQRGTDNLPLVVKLTGTNPATEKPDKNAEAESKGAATDRWLDGITLLVAIFTFCLALFTYRLWKSTEKLWLASIEQSKDVKESLKIARESADTTKAMVKTMEVTAASELRAYIGITGVEPERDGVRIKFINSGATPAHNAFMHAFLSVANEQTLEQIRGRAANERAGKKPTDGTTIWKGIESEMFIEDATAIHQRFVVFVCGHILYDDVFGKAQEIICQFRMEWKGKWKFTPCLGSNKAT